MDNKIIEIPELVSCGVFDSRLTFGNVAETKNRKVSIYEFELPIDETGISYINHTVQPLDSSLVLCAKPGQTRHSRLPIRAYFIHLIVRDSYTKSILNKLPDFFRPAQRKKYEEIFTAIIYAHQTPSVQNTLYCHAKLFELLSLLVRETEHLQKNVHLSSVNERVIEEAIDYINTHYLENIELSDIAAHVHLTKIYFHNLFKSATGVTTHQHILSKRMERAKKLLVSCENIADVAQRCGFGSQSYFNYVFKKETGMTPKQYKKSLSQSYPEQ